MRIILIGAPGSGKGTIARAISEKTGIPTISTGELLRKNEFLTSEDIKAIRSGELLTDDIVNEVLKNRVKAKDC